jgi:tRNA threonylcarbamoyladenosine biosynthesis protein TsaE
MFSLFRVRNATYMALDSLANHCLAPELNGLFLPDEEATKLAGQALGQTLLTYGSPLLVALRGQLGVGKTTFCQGLGRALGLPDGDVKSPTFNLAHEHQGKLTFSHLDLYRLESNPLTQFLEAGLDEYLAGLCLVEWPERLPDSWWPPERLELTFALADPGRILHGRGICPLAQDLWSRTTQLFLSWEKRTCA